MSEPGEGGRRIGIAGVGAIALGCAAWLRARGHRITLWAPRGPQSHPLATQPLQASGVLEGRFEVGVADDARDLCSGSEVILIAVPANGHRAVMDRLTPHLSESHVVIVSSMASLSSLYLYEALKRRGRDVTVAAFGTTVLTARRESSARVRIMTRRGLLGVSALPRARTEAAVQLCTELFGDGFVPHENALATALTNINPAAHGPLALFNWTRIERAEAWPQYHYMTPRVSAVIERLDAERLALARAFGVTVRSIGQHFAQSFGTTSERLADIAAELHAKRGGPPGPTDTGTRFLTEDVPFGLVFCAALGQIAGVPMPATQTIIDAAALIVGRDFAQDNDLIGPLGLHETSPEALLERVA